MKAYSVVDKYHWLAQGKLEGGFSKMFSTNPMNRLTKKHIKQSTWLDFDLDTGLLTFWAGSR